MQIPAELYAHMFSLSEIHKPAPPISCLGGVYIRDYKPSNVPKYGKNNFTSSKCEMIALFLVKVSFFLKIYANF